MGLEPINPVFKGGICYSTSRYAVRPNDVIVDGCAVAMVAFAQSRPPPSARVWHDAVPPHRAQLFRDWLARIRFVRIFLCHNSFGFRARHDLKA